MSAVWYFDFISPFAYLQWRRLRRLPEMPALNPRPLLFAAVLKRCGQLGPAEIPGKREFTYRFVLWRARQLGIPLRFPPAHPFNPLPALRLCLAAKDRHAAVDAIFAHIWEQGLPADTPEALAPLAATLGIDDIDAALADPTVKQALLDNGAAAETLKLFGVPTMAVGERLFWGEDATDMALAYAADPQAFDDDEMQRVASLPIGVRREGSRA